VVWLTILVGLAVLALTEAGLSEVGRWTATVYVAGIIGWAGIGMVKDALRGRWGLDVLAIMAMVATLAVGEHIAALIVVLMLSGGHALEEYAERRAKHDLSALLDRSPQVAHVVTTAPDGSTVYRDVPVTEVQVGDILLVRPSEIVPVDGELLSDTGTFDDSSLTGESLPVVRERGDEVYSGSVNGERAVRIRALRSSADSQYQQIVELVRVAAESHAPVVRLADRFAVPFTLVSLAIAGAAYVVSKDVVRIAEVLVLATPCPLLIAAPVAFLGGMSRASRAGVIVKGGGVLEQLARIRSAAFDKTGTLTRGNPEVVEVRARAGFDAEELLSLAASAEQYSTHAFAGAILRAATERGVPLRPARDAREEATSGVVAQVDGREVIVGKRAYVEAVAGTADPGPVGAGHATAFVAIDGAFAGVLVLADQIRPEAPAVVSWLRGHGVRRIAMLTGDSRGTAEGIAAQAGITEVHAELLPADKVDLATAMTPRPTLVVGDGVNDAPVLAAADVGMAMGARGSTAAGDAADVVLMRNSLDGVVDAHAVSRHTLRVALQSIWVGISLSIGLMLVATTGAIPAVAGALIQELVDLATILNSLRALQGPAPFRPTVEPPSSTPLVAAES
jgi:heavy metal translocating P-type ATPase